MTLRTLSRSELCIELGLLSTEGTLSDRKVADLIRAPLSRWGLTPKRAVLSHVRGLLRSAGVEDDSNNIVRRTLKRLIDLGECEELYVGGEPYLAPTKPRWIAVGGGIAAYLGGCEPPSSLLPSDDNYRDIVRRFHVETDEDAATFLLSGVREISLEEWLTPLNYLSHASRRMHQPARSDLLPLDRFWVLLETTLTNEGMPISDDAEVRFLGGQPGEFFGRHDTSQPEGRWTIDIEEGTWCAFRRGYGEAHWHPCIIAVFSDGKRVLDLYDTDEWRWAVLARGRHIGPEEVVRKDDGKIGLTFPVPNQLRAAMDIGGRPTTTWNWDTNPNCPDLWEIIMRPPTFLVNFPRAN